MYENVEREEREAFANLFDYIRKNIIPSKKVVPIASLTTELETFMSGRNLRDSTKKHICRTLQSELGDSVQIFPDDKGRLLMVSNDLSLQDMLSWKIKVCTRRSKTGSPK